MIGVRDSGEVAGCRVEEEYHMIQCAAEVHCTPAVAFETQVWKHNCSVTRGQSPQSPKRPHYVEHRNAQGEPVTGAWHAFLRKDDRIHKASPVMVKVWPRCAWTALNSGTTSTSAACSRSGGRASLALSTSGTHGASGV